MRTEGVGDCGPTTGERFSPLALSRLFGGRLQTWSKVGLSLVASLLCASAHATGSPLAELGRKIFSDPSLSASGKLACASCHDPQYAYGPPPGRALAYGGSRMNQMGTRAVPSLRYLHGMPSFELNHVFSDGDKQPIGGYTWDGRANSLQEQARIPLLAANEMANASPEAVVAKLRRAPYAADFRTRFGAEVFQHPDRAFSGALQALEAFQQLPEEFYPFTSKYDAFLRGDVDLTDSEENGVELFKDPKKGNCASCHIVLSINDTPPLFTDFDFANIGVPRNRAIPANADPSHYDLGLCGPSRQDLTNRAEYCGMFRSPTLRNVALRDAYFHNGAFHSLKQVLQFYVERDIAPEKYYPRNADGTVHKFDDLPPGMNATIDVDPPMDRKLGDAPALTDQEMDDIVAFLRTLTDGYKAQ